MFDTSIYTIGWVCAIHPELVAAQVHLDTKHDKTEYEAPANDNNTYVFGSIGKHNVVIAALPTGDYGISSAASVARDMIRTFTNVKIGLMVGIAGGAPLMEEDEEKKQDIRLGDIVVSIPGEGGGGVYQYDYGKAVQGHEFKPTGHLNSPPASILTAVASLRADVEIEGLDIDGSITQLLTTQRRLQRVYCRPDATTDRLYMSSFLHPDTKKSCSTVCNDGGSIERPSRDEHGDNVTIHYGLIASANRLMKDAIVRDTLARDAGVLCFEMEAAGLMNQLPFLVIRGICDYSDTHKNDEWRGFAAMTAAAYAKKLLLRLDPGKVEAETALSKLVVVVQKASEEISQNHEVVKVQQQHEIEYKIQQWLAAADPSTNYDKALRVRHSGSGSWLLKDGSFCQSLETQPLIWLHGISGCGKTVLATTIIEHLQKSATEDQITLFFYFDFQDAQKQTFDSMLRSLIKQMYGKGADCQQPLHALYDTCHRGNTRPSKEQLIECFRTMLESSKKVSIVLDALDECTTRSDVFAWLKELSTSHVIITSRPEHDIKKSMERHVPGQAIFAITDGPVHEDIKAYIKHEVRTGRDGLARWHNDADTQELIENRLIAKAGGMFRWAACQLDVLCACPNRRTLGIALDALPKDLIETYTRILQSITDVLRPETTRCLQLLAFSDRPLSCREVVDALAVTLEDNITFDPRMRMPDEDELAVLAPSLISYTTIGYDKTKAIQLAHPSVKEYLLSSNVEIRFAPELSVSSAHSTIAKVCLAYLLSIEHPVDFEALREHFPLAEYSAHYWMSHAARLPSFDTTLRQMMLQLLVMHSEAYECFLELLSYSGIGVNTTPLSCVAYAGLLHAVQVLIEQGADVNAQGGEYGNALQAASVRGQSEVVKLLLDAGADVNAQGGYRGNALQAASEWGHSEIVKLLLDAGADVNAQGGHYGNALQAASAEGDSEVVKLLLDAGAVVNAQGGEYGNALQAASMYGHIEVVKLLLNEGAEVNAHGGHYGNALQAASDRGDSEIVKLLLDAGAGVNAQHALAAAYETDGQIKTAMQLVVQQSQLLEMDSLDHSDEAQSIVSIESTDSLQSYASSMTSISSGSSEEIGFVDLYIRQILKDTALCQLLEEAANRMRDNIDRFARNHSRLLQKLDRDLRATGTNNPATRKLRSKRLRNDISRRLFHVLLPSNTFEEIKNLVVHNSKEDRTNKFVQESSSASDKDNERDFHNPSLMSSPPEKLPPSFPKDESDDSEQDSSPSRSSEEDNVEQRVGSDDIIAIVIGSQAFDQYKLNVKRFVHPSTPQTLQRLVTQGEVDLVREVLETEFLAVARLEFSWLNDLAEHGFDAEGMADLLVDAELATPWIHVEPREASPVLLHTDQHLGSCAHHALGQMLSSALDESDDDRKSVSATLLTDACIEQEHVQHLIEELCGLAGFVPTSRDRSQWNADVAINDRDGLTTASITYQASTYHAYRSYFSSLIRKISTAFAVMQENKFCCHTFTVLVFGDKLISMHSLAAHVVKELDRLLNSESAYTGALAVLTSSILDLFFQSITPHLDETDERKSHDIALVLQILCLGLWSYSRAHMAPIQPFFLTKPIHKVILNGTNYHGHDVVPIIMEQVQLSCLSGLANGPVLAFRRGDVSEPGHDRYNVLATPEDIIDTWGPAKLMITTDSRERGHVLAIEIGDGTLHCTKSCPSSRAMSPTLHWNCFEDLIHTYHDQEDVSSFSLQDCHIIGLIKHNDSCGNDRADKEFELKKISQHSLEVLGTNCASWHAKSRTIGGTAGQYLTLNVGTTYEKRPGITVKSRIMKNLLSSKPQLDVSDLEAYYGVQFSMCTGLSRRVPLRVLLADVVGAYVESGLGTVVGWDHLKAPLVDALSSDTKEQFRTWLNTLPSAEMRSSVEFVLSSLIQHLGNTGIDSEGLFVIAWITPDDKHSCLKVQCKGLNSWLQVLEDSSHCATFACMTTKCFEVGDRRCQEPNLEFRWPAYYPLLSTEVYMHQGNFPNSAPVTNASHNLVQNRMYLIGTLQSVFSGLYILHGAQNLPTLQISKYLLDRIPQKCLDLIRGRLRAEKAHLRERGRVEYGTTQVLMCPRSTDSPFR